MMIKSVLAIFLLIIISKVWTSCFGLYLIGNTLRKTRDSCSFDTDSKSSTFLLLIPVLREQRIIERTLEHFQNLSVDGINLHVAIAGTVREKIEVEKLKGAVQTERIVLDWIERYEASNASAPAIRYHFFEAQDPEGDRATQLNSAVDQFVERNNVELDIIGVYDADSLPGSSTLTEVLESFKENSLVACQQPVHFVDAANQMAKNGAMPILIANALYQTTWTMIRELPRWIRYYQHGRFGKGLYGRNLYLIGHGEFIRFKDYLDFRFPEHEVTDGIQLGYRLSMSNKLIKPLYCFCSDDVPRDVSQMISQHKRWFGGCMRLKTAKSVF